MKLCILPILVISTFFSCEHNTVNRDNYAFFGGEIINPNNNYIILQKSPKDRDTLRLDDNNRFITKIKNNKTGVYTFIHGGEYQMLFLEPNDSIMFRLNTIDFDESLVFTGHGAKKNNYLVKRFLENEIENKKLTDYCQMEPERFSNFIDEKKSQKLKELNTFLEKNPSSDLFKFIAQNNINYNFYICKEIYPFGYFGSNKLVHFKDLPNDFYDYRKDIDYNNELLGDFHFYYQFLFAHFNNIALNKFYKNSNHHIKFNRYSLNYNLEKLRLMDSLVQNSKIKNYLLKLTTEDFIIQNKNIAGIHELLAAYRQKSTDEDDKTKVNCLVEALDKLRPGNRFPDLEVINYKEKEFDINSVINKPTVIYFWSLNFKMHYRNCHYKINNLKSRYPNVNFVAININDSDKLFWRNTINHFRHPTDFEYKFKHPNEAMKTLAITTHFNKAILVDENGIIVTSNTNLFHSNFENEILAMVHKKVPKMSL